MKPIVFQPLESSGDNTLDLFILFGAITGLVVWILAMRKNNKIFMLLGFFAFLILGGNFVFSLLAKQAITPIEINESSIETPNGRIDFEKLTQAYIEGQRLSTAQQNAGQRPEKILVIETSDKKAVILAESQYPIYEIKAALDQQVKAFFDKK